MSNMSSPGSAGEQLNSAEMLSALFANLVMQQTNLALMLLGHAPHPETGERVQDLEGARVLIDQLEMLQAKTKGNLDAREDQLLRQSLTGLRMAFVEAVEGSAGKPGAEAESGPGSTPASPSGGQAPPSGDEAEAESRKKFSKKY